METETRTRLYHKSKPEGKLFTSYEGVRIAKENGWKEAPWLVEKEDESETKTRSTKAAKKDK
jgi:hypothetical protein